MYAYVLESIELTHRKCVELMEQVLHSRHILWIEFVSLCWG